MKIDRNKLKKRCAYTCINFKKPPLYSNNIYFDSVQSNEGFVIYDNAKAYPTYEVMIAKAIAAEKSRKGSSRQAIAKYIAANYPVPDDLLKIHLKLAFRRLTSGDKPRLVKVRGSFKLSEALKKEVTKKPKKAVTPKVTKPKATKPKSSPKKVTKPKATKPKTTKPKSSPKKVVAKPKAAGVTKPKKATTTKKAAGSPKKVTKRTTTKPKSSPKKAVKPKVSKA